MSFLIKPVTAWMNRLGVQQKLLVTVALVLVAVVAVSALLLKRINSDLAFTEKELLTTPIYRSSQKLLQALQEHRGTMQGVIGGNKAMESRLPDIEARANTALAATSQAVAVLSESGGARTAWASIARDAEATLRRRGGTAPESFDAHTALIEQVMGFIVAVADETNATLDPVLISYSLMNNFVNSLPTNAERLGRVRAKAVLIAATKTAKEVDATALRVNYEVASVSRQQAMSDLAKVFSAAPELKVKFQEAFAGYEKAVREFDELLRKQILGENVIADPVETFAKATNAINGAYALADLSATEFDLQVKARDTRVLAERNIALLVIFVAVVLSLVMFLAVRSGVKTSVDALKKACSQLAAGEMKVQLQLASRDEFAEIARDLEKVVAAVRNVVDEQKRMGDEHEAGVISHRINPAGLSGAYAEMAVRTNALAQSHIDTKMKFVEVIKHYAVGDFSVDLPVLPGEKRVITEAAQDIKRKLLGVSTEIGRLADAAARGDFAQRGDEGAFENGYRDMVVSLNRLMSVSSVGLADVARVVKAISAGDLTQRITENYEGAFAELKNDVNATVDKLREVVGKIDDATRAVNTAAQEIASGNADLSSRTEEQASSLEETAASMEELNSTVKQNAENARQAQSLTAASSDVAAQGGEMVQRVVETMRAIQESSQKIADIIGVIDSIAFQTNILALNAAVEAARAGEQGRGFAVVASEVRNLAQRSAQAAKEIKILIDNSVQTVNAGSRLVDDTGATMSNLVSSVQSVAGLVSDIAVASGEQADGITQIGNAVSQMDEVTQQNAALVEQAAAAAESLEDQARQLMVAVSSFQLGNNVGGRADASNALSAQQRAKPPKSVIQPDRVSKSRMAKQGDSAHSPELSKGLRSQPISRVEGRTSSVADSDEWAEF